MTFANEYIGRAGKKQPDWFVDVTNVLTPLLDRKAKALQRYLQLQVLLLSMNFDYARGW